jgi:hypothetical protein
VKSLILLTCALTGCGLAHYQDRDISVWDFRIGTDKAFEGLQYSRQKDGTQFQVKGFSENQTEGLKQINQGLALIFEGLAKGAVEGIKP